MSRCHICHSNICADWCGLDPQEMYDEMTETIESLQSKIEELLEEIRVIDSVIPEQKTPNGSIYAFIQSRCKQILRSQDDS